MGWPLLFEALIVFGVFFFGRYKVRMEKRRRTITVVVYDIKACYPHPGLWSPDCEIDKIIAKMDAEIYRWTYDD